jgi:2-polyprenyl-6-methoxyphenol hydroxylase-like FAD-dependent oxidoreductase
MGIAGSRVAVIGGSIAGCAMAIALARAGCRVTVFERTRDALSERGFGIGMLAPGSVTVCFAGGHAVIYLIPDHLQAGRRLVNWGLYLSPPRPMTDPALILPGQVPAELLGVLHRVLDESFPPLWADVVGRTPAERISLQPIFDVTAERYVSGRLALAGDAGAAARPHTGSGAVKALEDALALESGCRAATEWAPVLAGYDGARAAAGNGLAAAGQALGHAFVEDTPDWSAMSEADLQAWWLAALTGGTPPGR